MASNNDKLRQLRNDKNYLKLVPSYCLSNCFQELLNKEIARLEALEADNLPPSDPNYRPPLPPRPTPQPKPPIRPRKPPHMQCAPQQDTPLEPEYSSIFEGVSGKPEDAHGKS